MEKLCTLKITKVHAPEIGGSESRYLLQKCAKSRLHASVISKIFPGLYPRTPAIMGMGWDGREVAREGEGEGREWGGRRGSCVLNDFLFRYAAPSHF
jgi:hypothetical protein